MSSIRFAFFVFFFYFCASATNEQQPFILQKREYPGTCPQVPNPIHYSPLTIPGRWFIIRSGLLPEQAETLTCEVLDVIFYHGILLNILVMVNEEGKFKTTRLKLISTIPYENIYKSELDASFKGIFYYVDADFFIFISVTCKEKTSHTRGLVVGVRELPADPKIIDEINYRIKKMEDGGFKPDVTVIPHKNCTYAPPK